MDQEMREKWASELESGNWEQAQKKLKNGDGYCCLGVLCKISGTPYANADAEITLEGMGSLPSSLEEKFDFKSRIIEGDWIEKLSDPVKEKVQKAYAFIKLEGQYRNLYLETLNDGFNPEAIDADKRNLVPDIVCNFKEIAEVIRVATFPTYH